MGTVPIFPGKIGTVPIFGGLIDELFAVLIRIIEDSVMIEKDA